MAPYEPFTTTLLQSFQPETYSRPGIIKFINGLPRYGFPRDISVLLTVEEEEADRSGYVRGIAISSCVLFFLFVIWSLVLLFLKLYTNSWASGYIERPLEPEISIDDDASHGGGRMQRRGSDATLDASGGDGYNSNDDNYDEDSYRDEDDGTSSTQSSSSGDHHHSNHHRHDHHNRSNADELSISSRIFWEASNGYNPEEELTMAVIAREQKADSSLSRAKRKRPNDFSTTTNGKITLVTMRMEDDEASSRSRASSRGGSQGEGLYRVYIPPSLRIKLLRTYHDCLVHPDDVNNPDTMIYEFFTWKGIRRDAKRYVKKYRQTMERGENAALVAYDSDGDSDEDDDDVNSGTPITLDVIAREQKADHSLTQMMTRAPSVFSTATNGSIQLITARGKDKKYRIVIPTSLQAKVLKTYHDCLVNPTEENNFEKVLYVHFTWNGIHQDVEDYVENDGLTEEMKMRGKSGGGGRGSGGKKSRKGQKKGRGKSSRSNSPMDRSAYTEDESLRGGRRDGDRIDTGVSVQSHEEDQESVASESTNTNNKPIGLDEIAKEQKKDKELRQLKKEEPFVFSTVRYGNTLLTTAQNFRDNKYRIVIPRSLQGRMLLTYKECLLNPTPDRNFDTLLYNHFTWNGIHDDVDYFVKSNGRIPKKEDDTSELIEWIPLVKKSKKSSSSNKKNEGRPDVLRTDNPEYAQWQIENYQFDQKMKKIRIAFLISGLFMIISSIMFFELGVNKFFNSLDDAQVAVDHVGHICNETLTVTGDYLEAQSGIQAQAKEVGTFEKSDWCLAADPSDVFPMQVRNATYDIGISLRDAALRIETEVKNIESDIASILAQLDVADEKMDEFKTYMNIAKVIIIFIDIIVLLLMISCIMAWMEKHHFLSIIVRNTIIIPTFIVLLLIFWVFTTVSLLGAMAGADFCASPDDTALGVILRNQHRMSSVFFGFLMYYVTGCQSERLPPKLDTLASTLVGVGETVHQQINNINNAIQQSDLYAKCGGPGGPSKLGTLLDLSDTAIHSIYDVLFGVKDIMQCRHWNPIYTELVYEAVCISGVSGLSWIFFTSLSMAIFSMAMITLRVAIYEY